NGGIHLSPAAGQALVNQSFAITQRALVSGNVFNDANGNSLRDGTEVGLAGWRVFLDANNDGVWQSTERSTLTSTSGNWTFGDLAAGSYVVSIVRPAGWAQTTPASAYNVTLAAASSTYGKNFGEK